MINIETSDLTGVRIHRVRIRSGQTLAGTAASVGVSESLLSRIENGHRRAHADLIEKLAKHFSVSASELIGGDDPGTPPSSAAGVGIETQWPQSSTASQFDGERGTLVLADIALSTAMRQLSDRLPSQDHVGRYRSCRAIAKLASLPLEALHNVSTKDRDPVVREAARQLLSTLLEAYCASE